MTSPRMRVKPREVVAEAFRFILGDSTKSKILTFLRDSNQWPGTNIGIGPGGDADIRWFFIYPYVNQLAVDVSNGDWIVKYPDGRVRILTEDEFATEFEGA